MARQEPKAIRQPVSLAPYIGFGIIFIILPFFASAYFQAIMTKVLIFALFAMSLDLVFGYTGLVSLGHAAYFGVAAYTTATLILHCGVESFWLAAPAGILMAGIVAAVFGLIALRVYGGYHLLVTFALAQLLHSVAWKWVSVTGGDDGLAGVPAPDFGLPWLTWNPFYNYYFVLAAFVICFFALHRIVNSPFGYALRGIRENELRMPIIGYNVWACKYVAFILGGLFAGVAGVLFLYFRGFVVPWTLSIANSALVLFIVILGSPGTLLGSLIGSGLILLLEHFSSLYFPERWPLVMGIAFVVTAMYFPGGIGVYLLRFWEKVRYRYAIIRG